VAFNFNISRDLVTQTFRAFAVTLVGTAAAVPLDPGGSKQQLITTFVISNPAASGGSVYIGNQGVTDPTGVNPGFEVQAGTAPAFKELQEGRQLYELQLILADIAKALKCTNIQLQKIPFVVFDMSQIFAFSTVNLTFTVITFPTMYL
jgi:hypothetical protein